MRSPVTELGGFYFYVLQVTERKNSPCPRALYPWEILTGHQLLHLQMATKHVLYGNGRVLNWSNIKWGEEAFVKVQLLQLLTSFCPLAPLDGHNRFCRSGRQVFPVSTGSLDGCRNDQIRHQREAVEDRGRHSPGQRDPGHPVSTLLPQVEKVGLLETPLGSGSPAHHSEHQA